MWFVDILEELLKFCSKKAILCPYTNERMVSLMRKNWKKENQKIDKELHDVLMEISIVAKRLADNIEKCSTRKNSGERIIYLSKEN